MERKQFAVGFKADERGRGTAVISTLGVVDLDGDIVEAGAFGKQRAVLLLGHDWSSFPLGLAEIREQGDKAIADLELNLASSGGRDAYEWLKFDHARGGLQEFSYGFSIAPNGAEMQRLGDGRTIRRLKSLRIHEVSMVVRAAGVGTGLVAIKGGVVDQAALRAMHLRVMHQRVITMTLPPMAQPDPGAGAYRYRFTALPPDDPRNLVAYGAAKAAAAELNISRPLLMWFEDSGSGADFASDTRLLGRAWRGKHAIMLNVITHGREELIDTCRHECFHLAHPAGSEREAELFASADPRQPPALGWDEMLAVTV